uniref:Uncharacterized protein n=1 Tax=Petromyzon marinus TaxID=7757 RepID=S4RBK9_PETMA
TDERCVFCNRDEQSSLGQGELKRFNATPGLLTPVHYPTQKAAISRREQQTKFKTPSSAVPVLIGARQQHRHQEAVQAKAAVCCCSRTPAQALSALEELQRVGLPDDVAIRDLLKPTGHCWAHHCCAAWSEGVCLSPELELINVDRAVLAAVKQRCQHCRRLGATVKCWVESCSHMYHYPCAAVAGTFQDIRSLALLCPDHVHQAVTIAGEEANCVVCDQPGELHNQLFCTSCGQHYHGRCLEIAPSTAIRAGWQCPECKTNKKCMQPGDDSKMLVCDACDKGFHTYCLRPAMQSIPKNTWKCKHCRSCSDCGSRSAGAEPGSRWHRDYSLCERCHQQRASGRACPVCGRAHGRRPASTLLACQRCSRMVHAECEESGVRTGLDCRDYLCPLCRPRSLAQRERPRRLPPPPGTAPGGRDVVPFKPPPMAALAATAATTSIHVHRRLSQLIRLAIRTHTPRVAQIATQSLRHDVPLLRTGVSNTVGTYISHTLSTQVIVQDNLVNLEKKKITGESPCASSPLWSIQISPPSARASVGAEQPTQRHGVPRPVDRGVAGTPGQATGSNPQPLGKIAVPGSTAGTVAMSRPSGAAPAQSFSTSGERTALSAVPVRERLVPTIGGGGGASGGGCGSSGGSGVNIGGAHKFSAYSMACCSGTSQSVMPRIGMGKPAIFRQRFSTGRSRIRHLQFGILITVIGPNTTMPSREPCATATHARDLTLCHVSLHPQGPSVGFRGRRFPRGGPGGHPQSRGRGRGGSYRSPTGSITTSGGFTPEGSMKKEEPSEDAMPNTVVLFSTNDKYTLKQDMCVVCGSFGLGAEGQLLACSQCGQCYHPYCVGTKITRVVLSKGWRCLECTVCESCGLTSDPGRLLLCDDCDISYHIYCLEPPLHTVPKGGWKCKWCVCCLQCGASEPGFRCEWQNNHTQCAPCTSLSTCPVCSQAYREQQLIVQCRQCDRWMHGSCEGLHSEEEVEKAADDGFDCSLCRQHSTVSLGFSSSCTVGHWVQCPSSTGRERGKPAPRLYTQDGVCLTESGLHQLQRLALEPSARRRRVRARLRHGAVPGGDSSDPGSSDITSPRDAERSSEQPRRGQWPRPDSRSDTLTSPEREGADGGRPPKEETSPRKRKLYRPGVGGFLVRRRCGSGWARGRGGLLRGRSLSLTEWGPSAARTSEGSDGCIEPSTDEGLLSPDSGRLRKNHPRKRARLEDTFPPYLQEAFFGKSLLDSARDRPLDTTPALDDAAPLSSPCPPLAAPSAPPGLVREPVGGGAVDATEDPLTELSDDILGILTRDLGRQPADTAIFPLFLRTDKACEPSQPPPAFHARSLDNAFLPSDLDRMVPDDAGFVACALRELTHIEGKDVEELFTALSSQGGPQPQPLPQQPPTSGAVDILPEPFPGLAQPVFSALGSGCETDHNPPSSPLSQCRHCCYCPRSEKRATFSPAAGCSVASPASPWSGSQPPGGDERCESDGLSYNQRSALKWERDEELGEMATISAVLYANINFPGLRHEFPDWPTRSKQIAKLWRKASTEERAPYLQKARDNRAALRITRAQSGIRPPRKKQLPETYYPSTQSDDVHVRQGKEHHRLKEVEQEHEWKQRQQLRLQSKQQAKLEATQKLELAKQEQQKMSLHGEGAGDAEVDGAATAPASEFPDGESFPSAASQAEPARSPFAGDGGGGDGGGGKLAPFSPRPLSNPKGLSLDDVFVKPRAAVPPPAHEGFPQAAGRPHTELPPESGSGSRPASPWDPYPGAPEAPASAPGAATAPATTATSATTPPSAVRRHSAPSLDPYGNPPGTPRPVGTLPADSYFAMPKTPQRKEEPAFRRGAGEQAPRATALCDPYAKAPGTPRPSPIAEPYFRAAGPPPSLLSSRPDELPPPQQQQQQMFKAPFPAPQQMPLPIMSPSGVQQPPLGQPCQPPMGVSPGGYAASPSAIHGSPVRRPPSATEHYAQQQQTLPTSPYGQAAGAQGTLPPDPYVQAPHTPRPLVTSDPYAQPPGTPRPLSSDPYAQPPHTPRPLTSDPYAQPPGTPRPMTSDPYAQPPGTPRPMTSDPYAQPPGTPRPMTSDPYAQPPGTPRPFAADPYARQPQSQP